MAMGSSEAQAILSRVPVMDERLDAEFKRLAVENPDVRARGRRPQSTVMLAVLQATRSRRSMDARGMFCRAASSR